MSTAEHDPLNLTSLDADSLFDALGAVDRAIPDLLLSVKPVLSHLTSPAPDLTAESADRAIESYMSTLDKIQFVLRQTVYYLRETRASTSALRPPAVGAIPTPFAASLPTFQDRLPEALGRNGAAGAGTEDGGQVREDDGGGAELGLYGMRMESRVMRDLEATLARLREEMKTAATAEGEKRAGRGVMEPRAES